MESNDDMVFEQNTKVITKLFKIVKVGLDRKRTKKKKLFSCFINSSFKDLKVQNVVSSVIYKLGKTHCS